MGILQHFFSKTAAPPRRRAPKKPSELPSEPTKRSVGVALGAAERWDGEQGRFFFGLACRWFAGPEKLFRQNSPSPHEPAKDHAGTEEQPARLVYPRPGMQAPSESHTCGAV